MEKRIELEKRGMHPGDVTELNLDSARSTNIQGLTDEFKNLTSLSLNNVGLTTLKGFPSLPKLKKLELCDNRLSSGLNALQGCKNITTLALGGNKIKDLESLEPLKELPNLKNLDLVNCEVTNIDDYRNKVFELLPTLEYLDGTDRNEEEADDEEDEDDEDGEEANGDVDEGEDDDEDDEEGSEEEDGDDVGLSYLQKSGLEDDSEGEDFEPEDDNDEDESLDEEEENEGVANLSTEVIQGSRGVKRKRSDDEDKDE